MSNMSHGNSRTALACVVTLLLAGRADATTYYVDAAAQGNGTGDSWEDAFTTLQAALDENPGSIDDVWVAAGTYIPTAGTGREKTFAIPEGVPLYGGFLGNAHPSGGETERPQRNPEKHETVLSGDLGTADDPSDNAYHVVSMLGHLGPDGVARLDGFTITRGQADGTSDPNSESFGGGLFVSNGDGAEIQIVRCRFEDNYAESGGGGAYVRSLIDGLVVFSNCVFINNEVDSGSGSGGGLCANSSRTVMLTNCLFRDNAANSGGGATIAGDSTAEVGQCTFYGNVASAALAPVGALRFLEESGQSLFAVVSNSIFWENDGLQIGAGGGGMGDVEVNCSDVEGGWSGDGSGNVDTDPEFCDAGAGNLRLLNISPLIDTGCDEYLPEDQGDVDDDGSRLEDLPLDLLKSPRVVDAAAALDDVDMGAYEYNDCPWDFDADNDIDLADLATMLSKFGSEHCEQDDACRADFDCDGQVGLVDLATFLARYGETCSGFTPVEGQLAASISPWNTGGYSGGGFEGESQHFVFDALIEIDEEDDDWTVSGTVITATNGAVFRLAPVDPNSDVPIPGSGEPDKYATFFSVPKSVNANGRFNNPMGDDGAIAGA